MLGIKTLSTIVLALTAQGKYIVPGARWRDTDGNLVNAHAGGILFDEKTDKFWWFGEYKVEGQEEGGGVSVYSSEDLATWEAHGKALGMALPFTARYEQQLIVCRAHRRPPLHFSGAYHPTAQGGLQRSGGPIPCTSPADSPHPSC